MVPLFRPVILADHDFPIPGLSVTPCGYMLLEYNEDTPEFVLIDNQDHYYRSRKGPLLVVNRYTEYQPTNIETHLEDMSPRP